MIDVNDAVFLDTETDGLVWPSKAKVLVAKDTATGAYLSVKLDNVEDYLRVENFIRGRIVIGWNVGFDIAMMWAAGVNVDAAALWIDGCELNRLLHSDWFSHRLKDLARKYMLDTSDEDAVQDDVKTFLEGSMSKGNVACNMWRSSKVWEYCKKDVDRTEFLVKALKLLRTQTDEFYTIDSRVMVWSAKRYVAGVRLDPVMVERVYDMYVDRINEVIEEANSLNIPVNSPKALMDFFYLLDPALKLDGTNADAMEELACDERYEKYATMVLKYRNAKTRIGLMSKMHAATLSPDCRIHPMFGVTTVTGRLTCRAPNMQQWPRAVKGEPGIRDCMIADAGMKILKFDFSQQELRICCALIGGKALLEMIHSEDPHAYMANYLVTGEDAIIALVNAGLENHSDATREQIEAAYADAGNDVVVTEKKLFGTKLVRTTIKTIVFSQLYGAGLKKVALQLKQPIKQVAGKYYGLQKLFARYQPRPDIRCYYGTNLTSDSPHKALNRYGQGTGAEISKRTVCRILDKGLDLLATVHDDFKVQVPIDCEETSSSVFKPIVDEFEINGIRMEGDYA